MFVTNDKLLGFKGSLLETPMLEFIFSKLRNSRPSSHEEQLWDDSGIHLEPWGGLVTELFLTSSRQRFDIFAERYPLLLQAIAILSSYPDIV